MSSEPKDGKSSLNIAKEIVYETKYIGVISEIFAAAELSISDILDTKELSY